MTKMESGLECLLNVLGNSMMICMTNKTKNKRLREGEARCLTDTPGLCSNWAQRKLTLQRYSHAIPSKFLKKQILCLSRELLNKSQKKISIFVKFSKEKQQNMYSNIYNSIKSECYMCSVTMCLERSFWHPSCQTEGPNFPSSFSLFLS